MDGPAQPPEAARTPGSLIEHAIDELGQRLYRSVGLVFLFAVIFRYLNSITYVLLIAFIGVILGIAYNAAVVRLPFGRKISTALLAVATIATLAAIVWFGISILAQQLRSLVSEMPSFMATVEEWERWLQNLTGIDLEVVGPHLQQFLEGAVGGMSGGNILAGAFGLIEVIAIFLLVLVGAFFIVAKPDEQLLTPLIRAVPQERRPAFKRLLSRLGERLSAWLWGTLLSMLIIGGLSALIFWLLGTPYPLLLGVIVGLTDIIPLIGPWIGGIIAVTVTLFHDPMLAVWVAVSILVIQEVEGNLVRPVVMSEAAQLHPFVTLLALLLFSSMFGLLGAVLSLPLVIALGTIVEVLWVEETLGAGDDEIEPLVTG